MNKKKKKKSFKTLSVPNPTHTDVKQSASQISLAIYMNKFLPPSTVKLLTLKQ